MGSLARVSLRAVGAAGTGGGGGGSAPVDGVAMINALSPKALISAASVTGVADGAALTAPVTDLSGSGNHATIGGTGPLFSVNGAPNNSGAFVQRSGGWLALSASGIWGGASAGHAFIFVRSTGNNTYGPWGIPGEDNYPWNSGGANSYSGAFTGGGQQNWNAGLTESIWTIYEAVSTGSVRTLRVNGADRYSAASAFAAPGSAVICGTNGGSGTSGHFLVAGFVAFNRALNDTDAATVRAGMQAIHGNV